MIECGERGLGGGIGMDEGTRLFWWLLGGEGVFALLGGAFGAITGFFHARSGRSAGTRVGQGVARAYDRLSDDGLSPVARGTVVGGTDGVVFGVVVGTVVGLVAAWHVPGGWAVFRPAALAGVLLVGTAVALGLFAGLMAFIGVRAVVGLFIGGMAGALAGFAWARADGLFVGILAG